MIRIYHNPRCRKSREALEEIQHACKNPEIVDYQKTPLTAAEIKTLLKKLGLKPLDIIRTNEQIFKSEFQGKDLSDDDWIKAIVKYPILLQRPIVVNDDKAVIARVPGALKDIL